MKKVIQNIPLDAHTPPPPPLHFHAPGATIGANTVFKLNLRPWICSLALSIFFYMIFFWKGVFQETNEMVVRNTIRRLPVSFVIPLVKEIDRGMSGHAQQWVFLFFCVSDIMYWVAKQKLKGIFFWDNFWYFWLLFYFP